MDTESISSFIASDLVEVSQILGAVIPTGEGHLGQALLHAKRVFLVGQGRTGLVLRMFAMRLMQTGYETYMIGDVTTPAIEAGDILIAASGSGETEGVVRPARKAKSLGAKVYVVTAASESTLVKLSDHLTILPGQSPKISMEGFQSRLPLASALEQSMLLFLDCVVAWLAVAKGETKDTMMSRHANLE